ncbi:MAG: hypothetical protein Q9195_005851 [Heterodermia aff. obscurata]
MDEYTADAFVNREEPVPTIAVSRDPDLSTASSDENEHAKSKRERLKEKLSSSALKEKLHDVGNQESGASLQDRLFSNLLAVCTFVCLDPYLLSILPAASAVLFILVPAFLARHPPPLVAASDSPSYSLRGPPLAPPSTIKPAAEMSKDFFRNMRDLQNSMDDFSTMHDAVIRTLAPPTNFSNESLSSSIFLFLFIASCVLFLASQLLPWRFLSLAICWSGIILGHPSVQQLALAGRESHLRPHEKKAWTWLDNWISSDIVLDAPPEEREVEVFELQRRKGGRADEWEPWIFSPTPFDPLSPQRISGDRAKGTRFFEDVQPPTGWEWGDKKWVLDMSSREWVEERMMQGLEVEIEGERWVFDMAAERIVDGDGPKDSTLTRKSKMSYWEEETGMEKTGEWRRRRWVRMVRRKAFPASE